MRCDTCASWTLRRETLYDDGSVVTNYEAPGGKGHCEVLNLDTTPEFGCTSCLESPSFTHVYTARKIGEPWQHFTMIMCPDCSGAGNQGDGMCRRCCGTRNVRLYDDGYVGDERTRRHPNEVAGLSAKPTCLQCKSEVEFDWVACPRCGNRLVEPPAATEVIGASEFCATNATPEALAKASADKRAADAARAQ